MSLKVGASASSKKPGRKTFHVRVLYSVPMVLVGNKFINRGIGLSPETIRNIHLTAAKELSDLPHLVEKHFKILNNSEAYSDIKMRDPLFVSEETCNRVLSQLMKLGLRLRNSLCEEVKTIFEELGFLNNLEVEPPFLVFTEEGKNKETELPVPVLWELLYEGSLLKAPDWTQFWGFRTPITHGIPDNRPDEIQLKQAFSAVHEDMTRAGQEINEIFRGFPNGVRHRSLKDIFQEKCEEKLPFDDSQGDANQIQQWKKICQSNVWLKFYLDWLYKNPQERLFQSETWKLNILASIFTDPHYRYDLFHFACHCKPSAKIELYTALEMKVGGEPISLTVASASDDEFKRQKKWKPTDPGSLVFLNACRTGAPNYSNEPPGFPEVWINSHGAVAVIVTIFDIPDYFACAFSKKFYEILFQAIKTAANQAPVSTQPVREQYLAEALLATRRYFMEKYNNPLGLAYVLYAVDGAHLSADFLPAGGVI